MITHNIQLGRVASINQKSDSNWIFVVLQMGSVFKILRNIKMKIKLEFHLNKP